MTAVIGYCVKCKKKQTMKDTKEVTMKNGRSATKGKCSTCGTGMYRINPGAGKKKGSGSRRSRKSRGSRR